MKNNEKLAFLEKLNEKIEMTDDDLSDEELRILTTLSKDRDSYYRMCVAEILVDFPENQGERILLNLTNDKDSLVRIFACESLGYGRSAMVYDKLKKIIKRDKDCIVRGFSVLAILNIACKLGLEENCLTFLLHVLQKEKMVFTKICLYQALYMLGVKGYLCLLANEINTVKYLNRCAVINSFRDIINDDNREFIKTTLIMRKEKETTMEVNTAIDTFLQTEF